MGKRSKTAANSETNESKMTKKSKVTEEIEDKSLHISKKRKTKNKSIDNKIKKNKNVAHTEDVLEDTSVNKEDKSNIEKSERTENPGKKKSDKNKKIIFEEDTGEPIEVSKSKQSENSEKRRSNKNKKIIFEEDTGEPINASTSGASNDEIISEDQVKDEDIDKFCDDITEEDNIQYENWVQLIEAKLKSNKNKSKVKT